jgi:hypothetical protein
MSNVDPDVAEAFSDAAQPQAVVGHVDPDIAEAFADAASDSKPSVTGAAHFKKAASVASRHPMTFMLGMGENALSGVTGGVGSLVDAVTGSDPGTHDYAYRPRTEAGKEIAALSAEETANLGHRYDQAFGTGPAAQTLKERIPEALGAVGTVTGAGEIPKVIPRGARVAPLGSPRPTVDSPQSIGAAAATPNLSAVSPETRAAVQARAQAGARINNEVLARHAEAESLPVPARLTKGQATRDPTMYSEEQNRRGEIPDVEAHLNAQNQNLIDNLRHLRENEVGPDVHSTDVAGHADNIIEAYKAKDAAATADISAKYKALQDANGGQFPIDSGTLYQNIEQSLHDRLLFEHAPTAELNQLKAMAEKGMTFEQYEAMRTNLARVMRSSKDGNEVAAAGVMRQEMENLPLSSEPLVKPDMHVAPSRIEPGNSVDPEKVASIAKNMRANGWQGRPLLVYENHNGLHGITGSHRIAAAKAAGIQVPIVKLSQDALSFEDSRGLNFHDVLSQGQDDVREFLKEARDPSYELMKYETDGQTISFLKPLADAARSAARKHFEELRADPAYKAAVGYNEEFPGTSVSPERFAQRFVIGGSRDQVALMRNTLKDDPRAVQAMGVLGLEQLRSAARVGPNWDAGNFAADSFGKAWDNMGPKQRLLFTPAQQEILQKLANVARNEKSVPPGSHVNYSNTRVAQLAEGAKSGAAGIAEHAVNAKVPFLGTIGRAVGKAVLGGREARAFAREHLAPGAGIDYVAPSTP